MKITSLETLDAATGQYTIVSTRRDKAVAAMNAEIAALKQRHQNVISDLTDEMADLESNIRDYCDCHRALAFGELKSRETPQAVIGFRLSTKLETTSRKVTWGEVVDRLQRYDWGENYLTYKAPSVNKEAFHADKDTIPPEHLARAGVRFVTEDEFYINPKVEVPKP